MFSVKTMKNFESNFLFNNNPLKKILLKTQFKYYQTKSSVNPFNKQLINKHNNDIIHNNKFNFSNKTNSKENILPDHLFYDIPKYSKNPENVDFPWLIGGAPFLELKVNCKKLF